MERRFDSKDISSLEINFRRNLINSITGFKSAHLLATKNKENHTNLALFSSAVHIGADPGYIGVIFRPLTVPRHSYQNIKDTGYFSLNHVHSSMYSQAHQCSAPYSENESEFTATGLNPLFSKLFPLVYVNESRIRIGLEFEEEHQIKCNDTLLVVGKIVELCIPEKIIGSDGMIDLEEADTITISGLDGYHQTKKLSRLKYAKTDRDTYEINWNNGEQK
jgi:flavin reductase (DIM6/NTAB) family NADH-FMN oxidoreductase RutF